ncbi:hypothetical protein [Streptomyces niveus]
MGVHYVNFALQGVVIYVAVCATTAWLPAGLRQLPAEEEVR